MATPSEVRVDTDAGSTTSQLLFGAGPQTLAVPAGPTATVRISVTRLAEGPTTNGVGIAEVALPGAELGTRLLVPAHSGATDALVLRRADDGRRACAWVVDRPLCTDPSERQPESEGGLRRMVTMSRELTGPMTGEVVARPGQGVERLLTGLTSAAISASSRSIREPAGRPAAAMDGNPGTGWVASRDDDAPTLTIALPRAVRTDRLQLQRDTYLAASAPYKVVVSLDGGRPQELTVDEEGYLRWPAQPVGRVVLRFVENSPLRSTDSLSGFVDMLPVGVSEVVIPGFDPRGLAALDVTHRCHLWFRTIVAGRRPTVRDVSVWDDRGRCPGCAARLAGVLSRRRGHSRRKDECRRDSQCGIRTLCPGSEPERRSARGSVHGRGRDATGRRAPQG